VAALLAGTANVFFATACQVYLSGGTDQVTAGQIDEEGRTQ
jgi:hypothetical protein